MQIVNPDALAAFVDFMDNIDDSSPAPWMWIKHLHERTEELEARVRTLEEKVHTLEFPLE